MGTTTVLVAIDLDEPSAWPRFVRKFIEECDGRLLIAFRGKAVASGCRLDVTRLLAAIYQIVGAVKPKVDVVPLFEFCGWSKDKIAAKFGPSLIHSFQRETTEWAHALSRSVVSAHRKPSEVSYWGSSPHADRIDRGIDCSTAEPEAEPGICTVYSSYRHVCVGGTFDRLHAGHRSLLAATAVLCTERIYLGITGDALLCKKRNRQLLEDVTTRSQSAVDFMTSVNPNVQVGVGVLNDVSNAPMPKQFFPQVSSGLLTEGKPAAVSSEQIECIVVSRETISGATWINQERQALGYKPLSIVVVNLVGATSQSADAKKLSSSQLRDEEVAAEERKRKQQGG